MWHPSAKGTITPRTSDRIGWWYARYHVLFPLAATVRLLPSVTPHDELDVLVEVLALRGGDVNRLTVVASPFWCRVLAESPLGFSELPIAHSTRPVELRQENKRFNWGEQAVQLGCGAKVDGKDLMRTQPTACLLYTSDAADE